MTIITLKVHVGMTTYRCAYRWYVQCLRRVIQPVELFSKVNQSGIHNMRFFECTWVLMLFYAFIDNKFTLKHLSGFCAAGSIGLMQR